MNKVADKRLKELANENYNAVRWNLAASVAIELLALRASHKRLMDALETSTMICQDYERNLKIVEAALAEARRLQND